VTRLIAVIGCVAEAVRAHAADLNLLDSYAGDGDLGVTMSTAATALLELLPTLGDRSPSDVLNVCGTTLARVAPSSGGTLAATALLRASRAATNAQPWEPASAVLASALQAAVAGVSDLGGAHVGSKTMLDALAPAAEATSIAASANQSIDATLDLAAKAADEGAAATRHMRAQHGRAGWLAERSAGYEDAGARLVAIVFASAAKSAPSLAEPSDDSAIP
jgi:dihydroxyacetone kinase